MKRRKQNTIMKSGADSTASLSPLPRKQGERMRKQSPRTFFGTPRSSKPWVEIVSVTRVTTTEVVKVLTPETFEKRKNPHTPDRFIEPKRRWA